MTRSLSSPKSVVRTHTASSCVEDVTLGAQPVDGLVDEARACRRGRPRAACARRTTRRSCTWKRGERRLQLAELEAVGEIPGASRAAPAGSRSRRSGCGSSTRRASSSMYDAGVPVFGGRLAGDRGQHRAAEALHLRAGVVDVELARDRRAAGQQQARDRVAERRPAGVADVQRPGGVGADELDVDRVAALGVVRAERGPGLDDGLGERAGGGGIQSDVDEAGARDLDAGDPGRLRERRRRSRPRARAGSRRRPWPASAPRWRPSRRGRGSSAAPAAGRRP